MLKPVALFDLDNTMYQGFSYFDFLEKHVQDGLISKKVLDEAMASMKKYKAKQQSYETTVGNLLTIHAAGLKGKSYNAIRRATKEFYLSSNKFFPYVEPTIAQLRTTHDIALVTGEPQFGAQVVSELFGIQLHYSSEYEVIKGTFTGRVIRYLASRHEKHEAIKHLMQGHGTKGSFAFGDSEGDIEMLRSVEHAICVNPTDGLRSVAVKEGWHTPAIFEVTALVKKLNLGG